MGAMALVLACVLFPLRDKVQLPRMVTAAEGTGVDVKGLSRKLYLNKA